MHIKPSGNELSRRQFVRLASAGSLFGLGFSHLFALTQEKEKSLKPLVEHKFKSPSEMTLEQVFKFAYQNSFLPTMKILADKMGKDEFLELLKAAASDAVAQPVKKYAGSLPQNNLAAFTNLFKRPNPLWKNALTFKIVEDTEKAFEIKVTECLWAKTFREVEGADIGYASICYPDYAVAQAFNQKIRMTRDKTLMQGHDCCNHRYIFEG